MNIEQFVKQVLTELAEAVHTVDKSKINFQVDGNKGVDFDLAVVTASSEKTESDKEAGLKIKVVSAGIKKNGTKEASEQVTSRVKFNITAYQTQDEVAEASTYDSGFSTSFFNPSERY